MLCTPDCSIRYRVKAHVHHYTEYMSLDAIDESVGIVSDLIDQYAELASVEPPPAAAERILPYNL